MAQRKEGGEGERNEERRKVGRMGNIKIKQIIITRLKRCKAEGSVKGKVKKKEKTG